MGVLFTGIGVVLISLVYNIPYSEVLPTISALNSELAIEQAKLFLFFNSLGMFVVSPVLFALVFRKSLKTFFKFKGGNSLLQLPILLVLFIVAMPIINLVAELNNQLVLPEFLSDLEAWMRESEDSAMRTTKAFLAMNSMGDLLINILLVGVLPAIGEELTFRGVIQQTLTKNSSNYHIGIWLTAILFSAIHFQFYGFLPRMLLGAYFGYLCYWSKNIWLPIFAHFVNNTAAVLVVYFLGSSDLEEKIEKVGTNDGTIWFSVFSILIFGFLFLRLKRNLSS